VCAILTFLSVACGHDSHELHEAATFPVVHPLRRDTTLTRAYVGQVRAIQHIEVRALERGYLQDTFVDEGQHVKKGQRLFQLMPRLQQSELQEATAELDRSDIELRNTRALADKDIVSPNELALARASYAKAKAHVSLAATHKGLTTLRAPFDGIVGRFRARQGSLIDEGDLLTTLSDNRTVRVYFNVSEAEYLSIRTHAPAITERPVRLQLANGDLYGEAGRIETLDADFDSETGTIAFRAAFPNPEGLLRHGETGKVLIDVALPNALLVPRKTAFEILDKTFVYVVDSNNTARQRAVTVGEELPGVLVISSGLDATERVLLEGQRKVRDGQQLVTDPLDAATVLDHLDVPAE